MLNDTNVVKHEHDWFVMKIIIFYSHRQYIDFSFLHYIAMIIVQMREKYNSTFHKSSRVFFWSHAN